MGLKGTRLAGLHTWGVFQPDRAIDFNGFFWRRAEGNVLVDPLPLGEADLARVREMGGARWIVLTNADHVRATVALKEALGADVLAPRADRELLGQAVGAVSGWYAAGEEELPEGLRGDVELLALPGGKTPGEHALYLRPLRALLFGDLVRSHASGRLMLLPDAKLLDKPAAIEALRPLLRLSIEAVLLGDGDSVFTGAREALCEMLETLPGYLFNRMNLDRVRFRRDDSQPGAVCEEAELSRTMTGQKLGFHLEVLPPGNLSCPYHYETGEEELFIVRTPHGVTQLVAGDLVVFPTGPAHAHQFVNDGDAACEFFALGTRSPQSLVHYPDTDKILVRERRERYRIRDKRDDPWEDEPLLRG